MLKQELREEIANVLKTLSPRREEIVRMRFGLQDTSEQTLEEIGQRLHLTRERIRQIKAKALRQLRHPSRRHRLLACSAEEWPESKASQPSEEVNDDPE